MNDRRKTKAQLLQELHSLRTQLDATERQRAEEKLQASTDRWQLALRGSDVGVWDWDLQTNKVFVSPRWKTMLGFGEEESDTTLSEWSARVHPEDLPRVRQAVADHFAKKTEFYESEHRVRCKDGSYKWILDRGQARWDAAGNVVRAVGSHTDITDRKRADDWINSLIDVTQDAVISINRQGRIVRFNPAAERMFGYSQAEVQGRKVNLLMPQPYADEHDSYITRYEETRVPHAIGRIRTVTAQRKNGEPFPIELSVTEIDTDNDVHYAAFIRDISDKVRLQEQLLEKERLAAIGETAAKFAHEIGNPLNGMYTRLQLLERRLRRQRETLEEKVTSDMQGIIGEVQRLSQLLQEFRSLSRQQTFNHQPTDVATVVSTVLEAEAAEYQQKGIRVEHRCATDLPPLMVDGSKLTQVLVNLCKNAVEAMPNGGTLAVTEYNAAGKVTIEVSDTGVGIPIGVNIFEPFVTTKPEGTGLGLPIVRQIIAGHGGTLTYTSEVGKGTTFKISLPVTSTGV
jgi:PAS domain S-box-containing protein